MRELINEFLKSKRIAMVGLSRNPRDFSRNLFKDLRGRGYQVVPVNPAAAAIDGEKCFGTLREVSPPVEAALLMTPKNFAEEAIRDCAAAGIKKIWIYGISMEKRISADSIKICRENNIRLITGYCPFMFLPDAAFFHKFHGLLLKLTGRYPK